MPAEQDTVLPAQDGRDPDARLERHQCGGAAEAFLAALAVRELGDLDRLGQRHRDDDELRDPHPRLDDERLVAIGVEQHDLELAAVAGVDEARRVHDRDAVLGGEPRARLDEAGVTVGDRNGEAGADDGPLPGAELHPLAGREIEAGIACVRADRQRRRVVETLHGQLGHAPVRRRLGASSAMRYGAKRCSSRRGRRATTRTPSGVSSRSSIGAPSA